MPFSPQQIMLSLAWAAFAGNLRAGGPAVNVGELHDDVRARLDALEPVTGPQRLVWGPASFQLDGAVLDNGMVYVVREGRGDATDPPHFTVAIRGTNPFSLSTWPLEDFNVAATELWPYGEWQSPLRPRISRGTQIALTGLEGMQSGGLRLVEFLRDQVATLPGATVTFTGHSLGGLLASTLALALIDQRAVWDPAAAVAIEVYSFAAPTAGNGDFARYTDQRLGATLHRIWNTLDVAPCTWDLARLENLAEQYQHDPWWLFGFRMFVLAARLALRGQEYVQPAADAPPLRGKPAPVPGFLFEAVHQHGQAYIELLELTKWLDQFDVARLRTHAEHQMKKRRPRASRDRRRDALHERYRGAPWLRGLERAARNHAAKPRGPHPVVRLSWHAQPRSYTCWRCSSLCAQAARCLRRRLTRSSMPLSCSRTVLPHRGARMPGRPGPSSRRSSTTSSSR